MKVIIGGGAGGSSCAARPRRMDKTAESFDVTLVDILDQVLAPLDRSVADQWPEIGKCHFG